MTPLSILAPTRYPWRFNSPRHSMHRISNRAFVPLNRIDRRIEGITVLNPWPPRRFDLVHAFNRIPIGTTPYVIGFESHLPRAYGLERTGYFRRLQRALASPRCRGIVAISEHARGIFQAMHAGSPDADALAAKLTLRYPNVAVGPPPPRFAAAAHAPLHISFVGAHFARKGGCVAVRLAELASARGVPLAITIVSALEMGGGIWTDPLRDGYFDDWRRRLAHPAITLLGPLPNAAVVALLRRSHFSLLATFGDTFGYGAIEAMMVGCPVIGTRQGALPEFIVDGVNGVLLDLPTDPLGHWLGSSAADRDTPAFERMFTGEIERMAAGALDAIMTVTADRAGYAGMRDAAFATVAAKFDAHDATRFWDRYYADAAAGVVPGQA